jgi:L-2,4-diaminobutyric acid acetyltransferase
MNYFTSRNNEETAHVMRHTLELIDDATPALRKPVPEDGADIWALIRACKPLDENSMYCNLIQCDHFRDTCVLAQLAGKPAGWISAYVMPNDPETLFVWQVAVSEAARGTGLGALMLKHLLGREECAGVTRIQTTITRSNRASWALFRKFATQQRAGFSAQAYFGEALHFRGHHDTEYMVTIDLAAEMTQAA